MNPVHPLSKNLYALKEEGKAARLHLRNGQEMAGKIGEVGDQFVMICELVGKEFYDALVRIDDISAISIRVR